VQLEEVDPESGSREVWRVVAEEGVRLTEGGERVTLIAGPGPPDRRSGDRRFRVSITPLEGETLLDDNSLEVSVHVTPEKVRVLYVEGYPRWEYRRLALDMLKRSDENIEFQAFLLSATPDFVQESTRGTPALLSVPTDRRALLDNYDVVILGLTSPRITTSLSSKPPNTCSATSTPARATDSVPEPTDVSVRTRFAVASACCSIGSSSRPTAPQAFPTPKASFTCARIWLSPRTSESSPDATRNTCITACNPR